MKAEPNDIDKEAATLFTPAPGMRTWQATGAGAKWDSRPPPAGWVCVDGRLRRAA